MRPAIQVEPNLGEMYRYEMVVYAETGYDDYERRWYLDPRNVQLNLSIFYIQKFTPCGVWISIYKYGVNGWRKFVNLKANKKWACKTKEEALTSFIARKRRHIDIYESRLVEIKTALEKALQLEAKNNAAKKLEIGQEREVHEEATATDSSGEAADKG